MPQVSAGRCPSTSVVVAAHFAQPPIDGLLAGGDAGIADARVFGECAFLVVANGPDMYAVAVALEKQAVACSNARSRRTSMGTVICPLLVILDCFAWRFAIPYFIIEFLTLGFSVGTPPPHDLR